MPRHHEDGPPRSAVFRGIEVLCLLSLIGLLFAARYHYQEHRFATDKVTTTGYVLSVVPNLLGDESYVMTISYADATSHPHIIRVNENHEWGEDPYDEIGEPRTIEYLDGDPENARVPSWFNVPVWAGYAISAIPALLGLLAFWGMGSNRKTEADLIPSLASFGSDPSVSVELENIFDH